MIVDMSKLSIIGHASERRGIIRRLQQLAVVQIEEYDFDGLERQEALQLSTYDDASERILQVEGELSKVDTVISFLKDIAVDKKSVSKRMVQFEELVDPNAYQDAWKYAFSVLKIKDTISQTKADINSQANKILSLKPWEALDIPLELKGTKSTKIFYGTIPMSVNFLELEAEFQKIEGGVMQALTQDNSQQYITIILHQSVEQEALNLVKQYGFTENLFPEMKGLISENIDTIHQSIIEMENELQTLNQQAQEQINEVVLIQKLHDYLTNLIERRKVRNKILKTDKAFFIGGWIPSEKFAQVKQIIETNFCASVEESAPKEDEDFPIQLENSNLVYPFEMITELYSLPNRWEVDPNAVMAFFYFVFFGIMLSDAGYGIILTVGCFIVLKMKNFEGIIDKLIKMLMYCGISTFIWGVLFGSWFGNAGEMLIGHDIAVWFNPITNPMTLLIYSLLFGVVHLYAGMAMKAYMLIKKGKIWDAIFDVGFWYLSITGLGFLFLGGIMAQIGTYMAMAGALGLLLTQGRHEKHFIQKAVSGVLSLYNITAYLSDVLSYSRLLALGLATGVIGMVVNAMGSLGGLNHFFGILLFIVVFIVGHVFNISISALGAYVHSSRLQYVEFFGKFYTGGGKPFKPLRFKNKFVQLNN